jgi:hypothetical protein
VLSLRWRSFILALSLRWRSFILALSLRWRSFIPAVACLYAHREVAEVDDSRNRRYGQ